MGLTNLTTVQLGRTNTITDNTGTQTSTVEYKAYKAYKKQIYDRSATQAMMNGYALQARLEVVLPVNYEPDRSVKHAIFRGRKMLIDQLTENVGRRTWTLVLKEKVDNL